MAPDPEVWYGLKDPGRVATPALLVWRGRLERNIRRAIEVAGDPARLRPHVKTHKCARITAMMMEAGIRRFKCATVAEAHMLGDLGVPDALVAYPLVGENARRFARLVRTYPATRFGATVDSPQGIRALAASLREAGATARVWVDLDVGMHRTGVGPRTAMELYRRVADTPPLEPGGLHVYDGHNHARELAARKQVVEDAWEATRAVRDELDSTGHEVPSIVAGGTPSFPCWAAIPEVELSPGTCFLHDAGYLREYPDLGFLPAALVLARVVSRPAPDLVCLDCGHKAIAPDQPGERGVALNLAGATTVMQSEEHWVLSLPGGEGPDIGEAVYILPTHICPTFALHREVWIVEADGGVRESWPVTARDRSLGI